MACLLSVVLRDRHGAYLCMVPLLAASVGHPNALRCGRRDRRVCPWIADVFLPTYAPCEAPCVAGVPALVATPMARHLSPCWQDGPNRVLAVPVVCGRGDTRKDTIPPLTHVEQLDD